MERDHAAEFTQACRRQVATIKDIPIANLGRIPPFFDTCDIIEKYRYVWASRMQYMPSYKRLYNTFISKATEAEELCLRENRPDDANRFRRYRLEWERGPRSRL